MDTKVAIAVLRQLVVVLDRAAAGVRGSSPSLEELRRELDCLATPTERAWDLVLAAFVELARFHPIPSAFGLWAFERNVQSGQVHVFDAAGRSAPTLGEALTRFVAFARLVDPASAVRLIRDGDLVEMVFERRADAAPFPPIAADYGLAAAYALVATSGAATRSSVDVALGRPRPVDAAPWLARFGSRTAFDAPHHAITLPTHVLSLPMPGADPHMSALLLGTNDRGAPAVVNLVQWVDAELGKALGTDAKLLPGVAARVGMSTRTLQRRLAELGVEFSDLVDVVRRRRGVPLVEDRRTSIRDVARALGYRDVRGFRAAFFRWTGQTPRAFRRRREK